jgi:hypothetical protein
VPPGVLGVYGRVEDVSERTRKRQPRPHARELASAQRQRGIVGRLCSVGECGIERHPPAPDVEAQANVSVRPLLARCVEQHAAIAGRRRQARAEITAPGVEIP